MSTTGEGDADSTFSYEGGGGGAGGKFRESPFRRTQQGTPYDRPDNTLRGITATTPNVNSGSWLTKLVMDPASNLISFGANQFFSSVFRKRLPAPPRQEPEANHEPSGAFEGTVPENQSGGQEPASGNGSHLINSSVRGGISELEQLLKQKTLTRPEIEHLTELLCSKAEEVPASDDGKTTDALPKLLTDAERHQQYSSASLEKYKIEDRSHGVISTPTVLEHEIASPAELAKAYMGSRPSTLSPSRLGMRNQALREGSRLLSNVLFTPKSPVTSFTRKNVVNPEVLEYGSVTPRSRGRSAIYNMTHTPYSRVYPTDVQKGTGSADNGYGGPSSSSPFAMEHYRRFGPNKLTLKRRSSMLDDDLGSLGPIRRIRQKPSLFSHRSPLFARGVEISSDTAQISLKQKLPLEDEPRHEISKTVGGNEDKSTPSTSYTPVPAKSSEIAARILQHLEKLTPKDKSSESPSAAWDKLPLKTKPLKIQDGHKLEGCAHDSTSQKQVEVEENGPKESVGPHEMLTPAVNVDTSVLVKGFRPMVETTDSPLKTFASQPPQKRQAFDMSAHEDYLEQDDYRDSNGIAPQPLGDRRETVEIALNDGKPTPAELKLEKTTIQLEMKSPSGPLSSKISDMESSGVVIVGKESTAFGSTASQAPTTSLQSTLLPQSVFNFDKPKEMNNSPSLARSSPPSELSYREPITWPESKPESSSSSVNLLSTATGCQQIIAESKKGDDQNMQKAGSTIGKSETVPSVASNGSLVSIPPAFSFTPSTSIANFMPSFTAASSSCHFGSNVAPSPIIKFGISADPSTAVSASSTSNISAPTVFQSKAEDNYIFDSLSNTSSSISSYAASSGCNTFGLSSSLASSTANVQSQGSFLAAASGFLTSSIGTVSQSTPIQFGTSASLSSVNISSSTSFGSSTLSSQALSQDSSFSFSSILASASTTNGIGSGNEPTSSLFKFVGSSLGVNAVSSSSGATGLSSYGASSSSSGTDTIGSSSGASFGVFSFSSSSASTPGINAASNSTSTFGIKFDGNSSASPMFTTNTAPVVLNSSSGASSSPAFSFSAAPAAASSPVFGVPTSPFAISSGDNNQINTEDSMAEDPAKSSVPSLPVFGQPSISPSTPVVMFGSANPSQADPFQFGGQPNQLAQENQSTFQASTSLGFNSSGSFSLGSGGGGDELGCKIVKVNPNKPWKK